MRIDFSDELQFLDVHLRNEFNLWNVHKIMNTSGLLQYDGTI